MPQVTIYLDRQLHTELKAFNLNVSECCQKALRLEIEREKRRRYGPPAIFEGGNPNPHREA